MSTGEQPSSTSQPSTNRGSSGAKGDIVRGPCGKVLVMLNSNGLVVGPNTAMFRSRSGVVVRSCVPICTTDWRTLDESFKKAIWEILDAEFEYNVDPEVAHPMLEVEFPQRFRTGKSNFRINILDKCENLQEKLSKCPKGIDANHWKDFVMSESSPEFLEKRKKNAENRKNYKTTHTNGRRSYAQRLFIEEAKNPGRKFRRLDMWYMGHEHPDGTPLESAKEVYDQVKEAEEKLKETTSDLDMSSPSIEVASDALHEIFGPEKKNRTRAVSSTVSKKRLQQASLAKAVLVGADSEIDKVKGEVDALNVKVDKVGGWIANMETTLKQLCEAILSQQGSQPPPLTPINKTEVGSISVDRPLPVDQNVAPTTEVMPERPISKNNPQVKLLDKEGQVVATGYLVTDRNHAGICHQKKVGLGEKKVYVENVVIPDAPIYEAPQNGCKVMEDVVDGGYLVWHEGRLKY